MVNEATTQSLVRLVGVMAIVVAAAWSVQVLGLGGSGAFGKLMWVVGAAAIAGVGAGLLYSSSALKGVTDMQGADQRV